MPKKRNQQPHSVLEHLNGALRGVYYSYDPLPDEPAEFPFGRLTAIEKYSGERVKREPESHVLISDYLIFSDYSGSDVERSNVRVFFKEHGDKPGVYQVYGGHGTSGIALRLDVSDEGIIEDLERLDEYPILDEEDMSEVAMELVDEAAESYGYVDFIAEVERKRGITILDHSKTPKLRELFWSIESELNEPYIIETGGVVSFRMDKFAAAAKKSVLVDYGIKFEDD